MDFKTKFKRNKGITLIALVVTIIVLLILAGVSINLVLGENGLITQAQEAKEKSTSGMNEENYLINSSSSLQSTVIVVFGKILFAKIFFAIIVSSFF